MILEDLDDYVIAMLRANALESGRSLEDEIKRIVAEAVAKPRLREEREALLREMRKTAAMTPPGFNVDMTQLIREDRDR